MEKYIELIKFLSIVMGVLLVFTLWIIKHYENKNKDTESKNLDTDCKSQEIEANTEIERLKHKMSLSEIELKKIANSEINSFERLLDSSIYGKPEEFLRLIVIIGDGGKVHSSDIDRAIKILSKAKNK